MTHKTTISKLSGNLNIIWLIAMILYVQTVAMCLNFDAFVPRIIVVMITLAIFLVLMLKYHSYSGSQNLRLNTSEKNGSFLERDLHTPYMIDDLFHTIIDLSDVETDSFEPQKSFINKDYNSTRKRILENWKEY